LYWFLKMSRYFPNITMQTILLICFSKSSCYIVCSTYFSRRNYIYYKIIFWRILSRNAFVNQSTIQIYRNFLYQKKRFFLSLCKLSRFEYYYNKKSILVVSYWKDAKSSNKCYLFYKARLEERLLLYLYS